MVLISDALDYELCLEESTHLCSCSINSLIHIFLVFLCVFVHVCTGVRVCVCMHVRVETKVHLDCWPWEPPTLSFERASVAWGCLFRLGLLADEP